MDWGYFHQPPMIAVFIKIGYSLFQNELGVRLMTVFASTAGILMLFKLSELKESKTFILVYLGLILTHAGVFMAVPDSPLIFFTLIFLLLLKKYLEQDSYPLVLILAVVVAALMYSKYHAIVLLGSVLFAAPKLLLRRPFWLLSVISILLFLPHILWQLDHDLVSFKFHWVVREKKLWTIEPLLNYLGSQLIILGPIGLILMVTIFKTNIRSRFDRVLFFIIIGFFGFFLLLSLRSRVEANWTATAFMPLIILGSRFISENRRLHNIFRFTAPGFVVLLVLARIYIITPWAGDGIKLNFPLKGWSEWASAIKKKADGKAVFFGNSYQRASMYSFYSGEQGYHWSSINYNGNQFELWDLDSAVVGLPVVHASGYGNENSKMDSVAGFKPTYMHPIGNYRSYRKLRFEFDNDSYRAEPGNILSLKGKLVNRSNEMTDMDSLLLHRPLHIFYYLNGINFPTEPIECIGCTGKIGAGEDKAVSFKVRIPKVSGIYFIRLGLQFYFGIPEPNSDFIKLEVKDLE